MLQLPVGPATITVDCANGVGARALQKMAEAIGKKSLDITMCNDGSDGILNDKVHFVIIILFLYLMLTSLHSVEQIM